MKVSERLEAHGLLELVQTVAHAHGATLAEVCGRARTRGVSAARFACYRALYYHPVFAFSSVEIGRLFGRDHSSILNGIKGRLR